MSFGKGIFRLGLAFTRTTKFTSKINAALLVCVIDINDPAGVSYDPAGNLLGLQTTNSMLLQPTTNHVFFCFYPYKNRDRVHAKKVTPMILANFETSKL